MNNLDGFDNEGLVNDLEGFDADEIPDEVFGVIPAGTYVGELAGHEWRPIGGDAEGRGQLVNLKFLVPFGGVTYALFDRLNLKIKTNVPNPAEEKRKKAAKAIAHKTLASICRAVGVPRPRGFHELYAKKLQLNVIVEEYEPGKFASRIKLYLPVDAPAPAVTEPAKQTTESKDGTTDDGKPDWM